MISFSLIKLYTSLKKNCIKTENKIFKLKNYDEGLALLATKVCYKALLLQTVLW